MMYVQLYKYFISEKGITVLPFISYSCMLQEPVIPQGLGSPWLYHALGICPSQSWSCWWCVWWMRPMIVSWRNQEVWVLFQNFMESGLLHHSSWWFTCLEKTLNLQMHTGAPVPFKHCWFVGTVHSVWLHTYFRVQALKTFRWTCC